MTEPPSPLRMLLSRHTKRREFMTLLQADAAAGLAVMLVSNWPPSAAPTSESRDIRAKNSDLANLERLLAKTISH